MTKQRRGRRTARKVWVNKQLATSMASGTIGIVDLLSDAADFMTFDTTILIVILNVTFVWDAAATLGLNRLAYALVTGLDTLDNVDMTDPLVSGIGPPWLYHNWGVLRQAAAAATVNFRMHPPGENIRVRAQRRFRENDTTLWLVANTSLVASSANLQIEGYARTLLLVP